MCVRAYVFVCGHADLCGVLSYMLVSLVSRNLAYNQLAAAVAAAAARTGDKPDESALFFSLHFVHGCISVLTLCYAAVGGDALVLRRDHRL